MTKRVFEYFIKHNPKSHYTKSIMVDKNLTEISAIEQLLPNVVIEICLFHVLKAVKIKISTMNMPFRANVSAKNYMQKLAYSQTYEQFLDNYNRMINDVDLKDTDFITYFNNNWLNIREMWCAEFRNQHFNLGDLTNNRIESLNQKLKVLIKKTSSLHHFYVDMKRFIDSQYSKAYLFQFNQMAKNKFYNTYDNEDINTALYEYRKFCTIYSSQLIEDEIYKAFFKPIVLFKPYDKTCFIQFKKEKEYHVHLTECNCPFYINFNLPCRHILRFIHSKKQSLFDPNLINKRWLLKTWFEIDFSSTFSSQNVESSSEKDEMEFLCTKLSNLLSKSSFDQIKKTKDNLIQFISKVENNIPFEIKELRNNSSKQIQTENFDDEIIEFPKETTIDSNLTSTLTHLSDIQLTITPPTDVRTPGRSKLLSSSQTVVGKKRVLDKPSVRLEKHRRSLSTRSNINQILSVHNQMDEIDDANRRRDLQNALAEAEGIWMEFSNNLNLSYNDKYLIETPGETLTQGIISHCQNILKKQFPHVFGLVDLSHFGWSHNPKVVPFYPFDVPKDDLKLFVQILNLGGHFICVSGLFNEPIYNDTDNCHCVFDVYDSLNINNREYKISLQRKNQWIVSLLSGIFKGSRNINFQLRNVEVTRQQNATDCGFHSLANAFWSCNAIQPGEMVLDMQKLRNHLIQIIQNQKFTEFPSKSSGHRSISLYDETDLDLLLNDNVYNIVICHCRTEFGGRNVVQCRQCKEYFHIDCIEQVPDDFENWLCDYRCNKGTIELD